MWTFVKRWATKLWGVIAACAIFVGMLGAYGSFSPVLQRKALTFDVVSSNSIEPSLDGLSLHLGDQALQDLQLRTLRFQNSGSVPIQAGDFNGSLKIVFHGGEIVKSSVFGESPSHLGTSLARIGVDTVAVSPLLLNPGDSFELQIATTKASSEPEVFARISGVAEVSKATKPIKYRVIASDIFECLAALAAYSLLVTLVVNRRAGEQITRLETIIIMFGLLVLSVQPMDDMVREMGVMPKHHALLISAIGTALTAAYIARCVPRRKADAVKQQT